MSNAEPIAPRERARSARREALLEAAEQVFAERGFAGATMAEIAARAGYSAGNLYNVFDSKEALFAEVCRDAMALLHEQQRALLRSGVPFEDLLDRQTEQVVTFCLEHRRFFVIYVRATAGVGFNSENFGDEALRMQQETEAALRERIDRAMESGEIEKNDPEAVSSLLSGSFHQMVVRWLRGDGSPDALRASARSLTQLLRRALTPGGIPA